ESRPSDRATPANRSFQRAASRNHLQVRPAILSRRRATSRQYIAEETSESVRSWLQSWFPSNDLEIAVRSNFPLALRGNLSLKWNFLGTMYSGNSDRTAS